MALPYKFSCSALSTVNGHTIKATKPDANGCYDVVVGCVGAPTRQNVIYETQSLIAAMSDPSSRFNICLRDASLAGEYGHPVVQGKDDIPRLLRIDESKISHFFTKIWIDDEPITMGAHEAYAIRAKVKPAGPYGETLRKSLEDPDINTAFSIRSLCLPSTGPDSNYEYRQVQLVVTFDAVSAPGFEIASKRYVTGNESFSEVSVDKYDLQQAAAVSGMESACMISDADIKRLFADKNITLNGVKVATDTLGKHTIVDTTGNFTHTASLIYRR